MDINSLKPLPAFDEPIDHIRKRISKHNRNQHVNPPAQQPQQHSQNASPMVKSNNVPLKQQHVTGPVMAQPPKHSSRSGNIRHPVAINPPQQQFIPHHPLVQIQKNPPVMQQQQMGNQIPMSNHVNVLPNRQVTLGPQMQRGPAFHPPMVLTPAMSGKNRVNPRVVIQTPPQTQPVQNQPGLLNVPSIPMNMNRVPLNQVPVQQVQVQNQQIPMMSINSIPNQPIMMYQTPMLVNSIPQNIQLIQAPIPNGQPLRGPINFQLPTIQNNQFSLPQLLLTNGILNQIPSIQKQPLPAAPKPEVLVTKKAEEDTSQPIVGKAVSNATEPKAPQVVVVHQTGNSFKAPNILVKNTIKNTNKASIKKDQKPEASTNIDLSSALTKNTALTSINQNLMKMVLDKLKHTTLNMLKGRLNTMKSAPVQTNGLGAIQKKVASPAARISNSPLQLMSNAAGNLGILSGFPASLDPKRVSVSFNPAKGQTAHKASVATNAPRTIEILHKNLNRTMPNNMTLEPFTATTHKKNGTMSIMLTSKHTGNRPIVIEAATGNILVSHVKGPDGNAQFVIQHARETTSVSQTSSTTSTTPAVTEEVEIEAEDIITTTTSTTSTTIPTTTSTGFNSVTTTVSANQMVG